MMLLFGGGWIHTYKLIPNFVWALDWMPHLTVVGSFHFRRDGNLSALIRLFCQCSQSSPNSCNLFQSNLCSVLRAFCFIFPNDDGEWGRGVGAQHVKVRTEAFVDSMHSAHTHTHTSAQDKRWGKSFPIVLDRLCWSCASFLLPW